MNRLLMIAGIPFVITAMAAAGDPTDDEPVYDPYGRPRNGPPLDRVFHKTGPAWILTKLQDPKHHPAARMPEFKFTEAEALDIMAYLKGIAGPQPEPKVKWPAWAAKSFDELDDDESDAVFEVLDRGKAVWSNARCSICHAINGPGGKTVGGFVDLRVGGIDLLAAGNKLKRDWLHDWIKEPKDYFPDTLMPRFRFSDEDAKALTEYILRDDAFQTVTDEEEDGEEESKQPRSWKTLDDPERASRGQRLIELSRCVVCHEIKGIPDVLPPPRRQKPPPKGTFEYLAYDMRCLSCHSLEGRGGTYAPDLTSAGSRLHKDWIAKFVEAPDMLRPLSQQMPKLSMSNDEAKIIATYMDTRRRDRKIPGAIPGGPVTPEDIERGRKAFTARKCFSCHTVGKGPGGVVGPDLAAVGDRLKPGYIWHHLKDPQAVDPYSPEPDYGLSDEAARDLAAYLSTLSKKDGDSSATGESASTPEQTQPGPQVIRVEEFINRREEARRAVVASPRGTYRQYCLHCHGDDGHGDGPLWATELASKPADLTTTDLDKDALTAFISAGPAASEKRMCPPWGRTISAESTDRLAEYILSLGDRKEPATRANAAAREREGFPWLLGLVLLAEVTLLVWMLRKRFGVRWVRAERGG